MKFPINWIREFIKTDSSTEDISDILTNKIGLETNIVFKMPNLDQLVVGKIEKFEKHPNADRLNVCLVNNGVEMLQIVCGAKNVKSEMFVILAPIGTILPGDFEIKLSKIRGIESSGMLCSYDEINLKNWFKDDGIADLTDGNLYPGMKFIDTIYYQICSDIIEVEFTANRRDAANILSIARELSGTGLGILTEKAKTLSNEESLKKIESKLMKGKAIKNTISSCCMSVCSMSDVKDTESPLLIKSRLNASEIKSISGLVDITNYIAHEIGRPLHVFDRDKISGQLNVENVIKDSKFHTLKDEIIDIKKDSLVITDSEKIVSLAGVMGSMNSSCEVNTTNIFLESANFSPIDIIYSGRSTNINSHARYRFEKGIDKNIVLYGLLKSVSMIQEFFGGEVDFFDISGDFDVKDRIISITSGQIINLLGFEIKNWLEILTNLQFEIKKVDDFAVEVKVPSFRLHDIYTAEDLIEEISRINGYENTPSVPLSDDFIQNKNQITDIFNIKKIIASMGYSEIITWSFIPKKASEDLKELTAICLGIDINNSNIIDIRNPISSEMSTMRTSQIHGMLNSILYQKKYGINFQGFFEIGSVYLYYDDQGNLIENSILSVSKIFKKDWRSSTDIYDLKADLVLILSQYGICKDDISFESIESLQVNGANIVCLINGQKYILGYIGILEKSILKNYDLKSDFGVFEVNLKKIFEIINLLKCSINKNEDKLISFSQYQFIQRDYSFLIDKNNSVDGLIKAISNELNKEDNIVQSVTVFDLINFDDKNFAVGIRFILQSLVKTFDENDLEKIQKTIISVAETNGCVLKNYP